jgi:hypothetical protein
MNDHYLFIRKIWFLWKIHVSQLLLYVDWNAIYVQINFLPLENKEMKTTGKAFWLNNMSVWFVGNIECVPIPTLLEHKEIVNNYEELFPHRSNAMTHFKTTNRLQAIKQPLIRIPFCLCTILLVYWYWLTVQY